MRRKFNVGIIAAALLLWGCPGQENPDAGDEDSGVDPGHDAGFDAGHDAGFDAGHDAGHDAGFDAGAPEDRVFALGITDNSGGPPQGAPFLNLSFHGATPGADTVVAVRVATAPTVDGSATDWAAIPSSTVLLQKRGDPIGMTSVEWATEYTGLIGFAPPFTFGLSQVTVKAAFDDQKIYFLFQWTDPSSTESVHPKEWFVNDGGALVRSTKNEDRAYLAFEVGTTFPAFRVSGCAAACHLKEQMGDYTLAAKANRLNMHTTDAGELVDVWDWKAFSTNPLGHADDYYWDVLSRKPDGPIAFTVDNVDAGKPVYMGEGGLFSNPGVIFLYDAGVPRAVDFDPTGLDAGVTIPAFLHQPASPNRSDILAVGKYASGTWTVEFSRALTTSDPYDSQFPIK